MLDADKLAQPFDRLAHRLLENHGPAIVSTFLGIRTEEAAITAIDTKLTAVALSLTDKLFLVRPTVGTSTLVHWEFFMRPKQRCAPTMFLYAAQIAFLQEQEEYRDTALEQVAVYLQRGPERYARDYYTMRRRKPHCTWHGFEVVTLWTISLRQLLDRFAPPFAVFGPFCAGDFESRVVQSYRVIQTLEHELDHHQWSLLKAFWVLSAKKAVDSEDEMTKLTDFYRKEEVEDLWFYRQVRQEGRQEGREETIHTLLSHLLSERFGPLPDWAQAKLRQIKTPEEAKVIIGRLESATDLESLL